jgi:hypothetical protein
VGRAISIRDGKTSTETVREVSFDQRIGGTTEGTREYLIVDSSGSVQIPREMLNELAIRRRMQAAVEHGKVTLESGD